jgi:hypothetical protein
VFRDFAQQLDVGGLEFQQEFFQISALDPDLMAVEVNREFRMFASTDPLDS